MAHHAEETATTPVQRAFIQAMQQGDDFLKIELLRPAIKYYRKALQLNFDNEICERKLALCERMLKQEQKVIMILTVIATILLLAVIILK